MYRWLRRELGTIPLADLTPLVLRTWRDSLRPFYQPNTIRRYMIVLSAVRTGAVDQYEWLGRHPLRQVAKPPAPPDRERCLTGRDYLDEVIQIPPAPPDRERCLTGPEQTRLLTERQHSKNLQLYVAVVVTLSTATRKNELLQRLWTDIDLERGLLCLPRAKNGERRAIPLVPHALGVLRQHAAVSQSGWVFPRADGRKPVYVDVALRYACTRAGIEDFHFHDLRHTSASYLAMSGASLREIAEILGHKSLKQTMKYTHLVEPHTRGVLEKMAAQFLEAPGAAPPASLPQASRKEPPATGSSAAPGGTTPLPPLRVRARGDGPPQEGVPHGEL